jgi:hypothetical protein
VFVGATAGDARELLDFADRLDRASASERAAWALRRKLGPNGSKWFPGFQVRPVVHRVQRVRADQRRDRTGVA